MALYDVSGTATGSAIVTGSLAVLSNLSEALSGLSATSTQGPVDHYVIETLVGAANLFVSPQSIFNVSGFAVGAGNLIDARLMDGSGVVLGGSVLTANTIHIVGVSGYIQGASLVTLSVPEPIYGVAVLSAYAEVICVPLPICEIPPIKTSFRWGHPFSQGDLTICVLGPNGNPLGPVCMTFTLYQVQRGCALKQVGPSGRKPVQTSVGCYYATGAAGECGQPGLWAVRWRYQRTFGDPVVEKDCYFTVLDSVLSPVLGDTLQRVCKYGWD